MFCHLCFSSEVTAGKPSGLSLLVESEIHVVMDIRMIEFPVPKKVSIHPTCPPLLIIINSLKEM
jgi:hypothetical protein